MSAENHTNAVAPITASSPSRRTVIKAGAWSVPVIAAAVATPLAAASTAGTDLIVQWLPSGTDVGARSADDTRGYTLGLPSGVWVSTTSTTPVPAGSTLTVSYDDRVLGAPSATAAGVPLVSAGSGSFILPEIPATGAQLRVDIPYATKTAEWHEDITPLSVTATPATGNDPDDSNNTVMLEARYFDTSDASLTATWRQVTVSTLSGLETATFVDEVAIEALAPGDVASGRRVAFSTPESISGDYPITSVSVSSATLDGVDVLPSIGAAQSELYGRFTVPVNTGIPVGKTLVLKISVDAVTPSTEFVSSTNVFVSFVGSNERDITNNDASAPQP